MTAPTVEATHECGMCDGHLTFDGIEGGYATWKCDACGWWHIAKDCCEEVTADVVKELVAAADALLDAIAERRRLYSSGFGLDLDTADIAVQRVRLRNAAAAAKSDDGR